MSRGGSRYYLSVQCPVAVLGFLVLLVAGGCAEHESWVELGGGVDSFEPFQAESAVPIVRGFQGAQHIWAQVRLRRKPMGRVLLRFSLWDAATDLRIHENEFLLTFEEIEEEAGIYVRPGTYAFVPVVDAVAGREVILRVYVDAPGAGVAEREASLMPWDDTMEAR